MKKKTWFISHPSGGMQHTPAFFSTIQAFAEEKGIDVIFPHDIGEDVQLRKEAMEKTDLMIVEVSIPSTGSGIEMGWAHNAGIPIHAFHQGSSEPSPAMKFVTENINVYVTEDHVRDVLQTLI